MTLRTQQDGDDALVWIKAVPNASRDQISGLMGERLKVRVSAPPEAGKANDAVCELLAQALGIKARQIAIEAGHSSAEKVIRIVGMKPEQVLERIKLDE